MKTYTKIQRFACGLLVSGLAASAFAQDSDQPPAEPTADPAAAATVEAVEDIPPPEPIPTPAPVPQPVPAVSQPAPNTYVSEDSLVRAYDFGVSLLPGGAGGAMVRGVIVGSAADRAGVKPRDTIVAINGQPVGSAQEVAQTQVQSVTIHRGGTQQTLQVNAAPPSAPSAAPATRNYRYSAPRTTYSAPPRYTYPTPSYTYRAVPYGGYYGYDSYRYRRPNVSIGIGVGTRGYPGFYGPGYGYGRGFYGGPGFGPGFYGGRSGVGIRIGGFGISF